MNAIKKSINNNYSQFNFLRISQYEVPKKACVACKSIASSLSTRWYKKETPSDPVT